VTFHLHGGTPAFAPQTVVHGELASNPGIPTRGTDIFVGWFTAEVGGVAFNFTETPIEVDTHLHARWTPDGGGGDPGPHTVTFHLHGGTPAFAPQTVVHGELASNPGIPERANHTFGGWFTAATGGVAFNFAMTPIEVNTHLHARWTYDGGGGGGIPWQPPIGGDIVITYVANDSTGNTHTVTVPGDTHIVWTLPATGMDRPGYEFLGWNTAADGSGTMHAPGSTITVTTSLTLYAQWQSLDEMGTYGPGGELERDRHPVYLQGFPDGSVRADDDITRAQAAAIFFRLLCPTYHTGKNDPVPNAFGDVADDAWFTHYVNYLAYVGVLRGFPDGTFRPDAPILREEFAAIITRFNHPAISLVPVNPWFSDVPDDMWSKEYIYFGARRDWLRGFPDGTFRPEEPITRGEAATVVNRMLERAIDEAALAVVGNPFSDITPDHWAFREIIEASIYHHFTRDQGGSETWTYWRAPRW